jgi:glycosyltransferase involved in cell wall biosynthesis
MGHAYEKAALKKAALALYSSDWAARSAVDAYGIDPRKVAVVPFGPNLDTLPDAEQVTALVQGRDADVCRLLFIGVEWERKGGDIAIEAAQALNDAGVPTQLTVIGCRPPMSRLPEFVSSRGFISKTTESGCAQLRRIMGSSHFLIHPARAEAFGVVFAEAAAFAVPAIASEVGGIPTAIRNGRNGYLLPSDSDGEAYATLIKEIFDDRERYRDLAMSSFGEYETRLSWRTGAETVIRYVQALS